MPTDPIVPPEEVVGALAAARRVGAVGHVGPDGDALGSILALTLAARRAGKEAYATFGEPFVLTPIYDELDRSTLVPPGEFPEGLDVVVACDTAARDRLGSVGKVAESATTLIVVDHHGSNDGFGDIRWIRPDAAATAQMIFHLLRALDWEIDAAVGAAIYTGIVTDTGRFQYSSTTPDVHHIAAELLEAGVRQDRLGEKLFEEAPFGYYRVVANVMGRAVLERELRLVWSVMYHADLEEGGIGYEDTDGLVDLVRMAREADVACLLKERESGVIKGSLRSRGVVDVAAVAATFGGGGHHNAAGFTFSGTIDEAIERVRAALR